MLYINPKFSKIIKARRAFHQGMLDFLFSRIDKIKTLPDIDVQLVNHYFDIVLNGLLDDILVGPPDVLHAINDRLNPLISSSPSIRSGVEYVFNYDAFIVKKKKMYDAYKLAEALDIRTCTYCNRNYTSTVIRSDGEKLTRPQFDHYFDKDTNPLLAVSFHNLIPSCNVCNSSIKGTAKMTLMDYTHPYLDNEINNIRFTYKYSLQTNSGVKIKVITSDPSRVKNMVDVFAIEEVYNSHAGELIDLLKTKQYFSEKYLSILHSNLLRDVIVSKEDIYRIVFGVEYDSDNFANRPFSKFKSDILKELGII